MTTGSNASNRLRRIRNRLLAAGMGAALGVATVLIGVVWLGPERPPEMNRETFNDARRLWQERKPESYIIEVNVEGRQPGRYLTEVRDGAVVEATRNGYSLNARRTITTWTVDGMFRTLSYDLRSQEDRSKDEPGLSIRTEFDPQYGIPNRYHRIQWGALHELTWEVERFEVFVRRDG